MHFPRHKQALESKPEVGFLQHFIQAPSASLDRRKFWSLDAAGPLDKTICISSRTHSVIKREARSRGMKFNAFADRLLMRAAGKYSDVEVAATTAHTFSIAKCAIAYQYRLGGTLREVGQLFGVTHQRAAQMVARWEAIMAAHSLNSLAQKRTSRN